MSLYKIQNVKVFFNYMFESRIHRYTLYNSNIESVKALKFSSETSQGRTPSSSFLSTLIIQPYQIIAN